MLSAHPYDPAPTTSSNLNLNIFFKQTNKANSNILVCLMPVAHQELPLRQRESAKAHKNPLSRTQEVSRAGEMWGCDRVSKASRTEEGARAATLAAALARSLRQPELPVSQPAARRIDICEGPTSTLRRFGSHWQSEAMQGRDNRREASSGELRAMHG